MAENEQDDSQKTEEPTHRRLEQAREKGQIARSQEVNHWFMILAMALLIAVFGEPLTAGIASSLRRLLEQAHAIRLDGGQLREVLLETVGQVGLAVLLPAAVILLAALLAGIIQNGLVFSAEPIVPKLSKLSLAKGVKRLFSTRSLVDFAKGIAKIAIVSTVLVVLLWPEVNVIPNITGMSLVQFMGLLQALATRVLIGVLSVMTVIAALDFLYQKQQHLKQLRMSKQDLKEEFKQTEGDPMIKARLRQIRMERARRRMMAAVPEADVVVTNPTHYAVALKYDPEKTEAPVLAAKGVDSLALRIREIAEEHDIPIVENPPLSRALYEGVELDQEIPPEHYKAVAEVIGYVMRLKGRLPPRNAPAIH
ncbi:MAG: flagellar biosynthesis protein FlhB [Kiloniellaceae bacterium]